MTTKKLVSIIVPVYNRASTIVRCLDSISTQRGIEMYSIIVVDNNSTDESDVAIKEWQRKHQAVDLLLTSESRQGAAIARNRGLELTRTPYVMFFDSDDEMLQGHLERLINGIQTYNEADILGWNVLYQLPSGKTHLTTFTTERPVYNHLTRVILATEHYAVKTDFIRKSGGWNADLTGWDDFELGARLLSAKPRMAKLDNDAEPALVCPKFTEESITGRLFSPTPEKWERALDRMEIVLKDKYPEAQCWIGYRRAVLAGMYAREGAAGEASRLLAAAPCDGFNQLKARICYYVTRLLGKGARHAARLMLPTDL